MSAHTKWERSLALRPVEGTLDKLDKLAGYAELEGPCARLPGLKGFVA